MKDYKKILEGVVNIISTTEKSDIGFSHICSYIGENCPELAESEDERIRKAQLDYWRSVGGKEWNGVPVQETIAWLEKQSGQKPFDYENANIQQNDFAPKFKLGDWIVWKDKCYKVNDNGCGYELIDTNGLSTSLEYGTVDEDAHPWTIADAKDGSILAASDGSIFIFKEVWGTSCKHYIALTKDDTIQVNYNLEHFWETSEAVHPATKEQRDLLFQKMEEDGYEFDFNKKELKKTPKDSLGISSEKYNEIVNECIFGEEKKSKWTEKDECMMKSIMADIEYARSWHKYDMDAHYDEELVWLKSLKHRLQ